MLRGCFCFKGPGQLVRIHGIMDSSRYLQILNGNLTAFARKLKMGPTECWTLQQNNEPNNKGGCTKY